MKESLWLDEATTALVSKMPLGDIFEKFLPGDFHPPLYYIFMKFWVNAFGNSEISLRTPSLIFSFLTILLIYKLAGRVAAALLTTAPLLFYYAQEARMYSMIMFFVTLAVFSFVKMKKDRGLWWGIVFALSLSLIAATDYVALLILPVFWSGPLMSHIILAGFWVIWLPHFVNQINSGLNAISTSPAWGQLLGQASFKNFSLVPIKFMIGRVGFDNKPLYGLVVSIIGGLFGYLLYKARKADRIYWLWLTVPFALGLVISFWIPIFSYFRFLFVLPAFYILVAKGIEKSKIFLSLVLCVNLLSTVYYVLTPRFHREDWRSAAAAIVNDRIVFPADSQKEALIYYGKANQVIDIQALSSNRYRQVWLSRYVWEVFDPKDLVREKIESLGYNKIGEFNFNGVVFFKYENSN